MILTSIYVRVWELVILFQDIKVAFLLFSVLLFIRFHKIIELSLCIVVSRNKINLAKYLCFLDNLGF